MQEQNNAFTILSGTPTPQEMDFIVYVLTTVYGWKFDKIKRFKLGTLNYWLQKAKKRMTADNLMSIHMYMASRAGKSIQRKTLWERLKN